MTVTNANSAKLAEMLADARPGFAGVIYPKKGKVVGGVLYGDEVVWDTFNHSGIYAGDDGLKARDLEALGQVSDKEILDLVTAKDIKGWEGRGANRSLVPVTRMHVQAARAKIEASCLKSMTGRNSSTCDHVYEALVVNGETVRGARVYQCVAGEPGLKCKCRNCTGDARAPLPGTIYLRGLLERREVITPAANGRAPFPKSNPVTVARRLFESRLPSRKYVQYRFEPGMDFILAIGGVKMDKAQAA
jgi:hypothetical protein